MANTIIGNLHRIGLTESITTQRGMAFTKREFVLVIQRFDPNTGEEYEPNYIRMELGGNNCAILDQFKLGDRVEVEFYLKGSAAVNKEGKEVFYTHIIAKSIKAYMPRQFVPQSAPAPQPVQQLHRCRI